MSQRCLNIKQLNRDIRDSLLVASRRNDEVVSTIYFTRFPDVCDGLAVLCFQGFFLEFKEAISVFNSLNLCFV